MNLISIDFETANKYRNSPCAIGLVVANEHGITDEFYSLINPLMDFDPYNVYVHGITERDVEDAPTFDELWPKISDYISNSLVVAHNASFDMSVLRYTLDRYELIYPDFDYLCSVVLSKQIWPGLLNYKLNTLATMKDIEFSHHNALEDARAVIELLLIGLHEQQVTNIRELIEKFDMTCGKVFERSYVTPKVKRKKRQSKKTRVYFQ